MDDLKVTEEIHEINLLSDDEDHDLLEEMPERKNEQEKQPNVRNDSGLETSDSMDAKEEQQRSPTPVTGMMIALCSENSNVMPKNVTITCESPEKSLDSSRRSSVSTSFIDSLLDKIGRRKTTDGTSSDISPSKEQPKSSAEEDLLEEMEPPVAFEKSNNPNMLPTPIVKNPRAASAFVNCEEEFEMRVVKSPSKESNKKYYFDKSKMSSKSQPPRMHAPNFQNIPKPRTLAEKRMLVNTNMDFLMIEQESKIFKQIERKKKGEAVNYNVIEMMMNEDIPISFGPWKALQWLRTQDGNYIQQHINIDGSNYRLCGSRGNHKNKFLPQQTNEPYPKIKKIGVRSVRCCPGGKIKRRDIEQLSTCESIKKFVLEETLEPYKRLESKNIHSQLSSIMPRPLGKKIEFINHNRKLLNANEDSMFLGEFSKFEMPDIKLEVTVQNKVPINTVAKQYLNELIPHRDLNEGWLRFALSPVKSQDNVEEDDKKVFEFVVPYQENKQHILVREILKSKQDTEKLRIIDSNDDDIDEMEWTFAANADKNDKLEMEVIDIIKDLTNSVFINLNDDLFTLDDTEDRSIPLQPIKPKEVIEELATSTKITPKNDKSLKVLKELKRLNANVVKSNAAPVGDEEDILRHATAHLGREERELRATVIVTDSDAVLLGSKEKEIKRKKRVPKRFSDFLHPNANPEDDFESDLPPSHKKVRQNIEEQLTKNKTPPPEKCTSDDLKAIRQELQKWLHVTVDLNRMEFLSNIHPWCMLHNAYKCACKSVGLTLTPEYKALKRYSNPSTANNSVNSSRCNSIDKDVIEVDHPPPRRVLPVELVKKDKPKKIEEPPVSSHEMPQMEIVNLGELISCGIGPIFINIYDTKENRLKPLFRNILNNRSALAYIDGFAYFIDTTRVDVRRLNFDKMRPLLEHAIFIIMPKITYRQAKTPINEDFVQLLFCRDSDVLKDITDKTLLKEVADVIETILQNAKKKVEDQLQGVPNEHIRGQLNMIRRDRLCSESTNSSALTSPLHFQGKELEKAPSPDPVLMKEFNRIFSVRMQRLCAMIKSNVLGLHPLEGYMNKFYIYQWSLLLQAYESHIIYIWQAKITQDGENSLMLAITNTIQPPVIENVLPENVINIRKLSLTRDKITELTRLILLRVETTKTQNMTLLLYGCEGYFRVCGILNSKENFVDGFVAKPSRVTHPRLTAKIQKIYNIWHGLKKSKEKFMNEKRAEEAAKEVPKEVEEVVKEVEKVVKPKEVPKKVEQPKRSSDVEIIEPPPTKKQRVVEEKESDENLANNEPVTFNTPTGDSKLSSDKKWFLFNLTNDFTDIFVKQWSRYLPYSIIMKGIKRAKESQKAIQLVPEQTSRTLWPRVYALPNAPLKFKDAHTMTSNYIIFGPYLRNLNSNLLLMQSDGDQKYLRDDYEKIHNIKRQVRTRCIWIYANTLKCLTDDNVEKMPFLWSRQSNIPTILGKKTNKDDKKDKTLKISSIVGGFIQNGSD